MNESNRLSLLIGFACLGFLFASTVFLFWESAQGLSPTVSHGWWSLAFAHPEEANDYSFVVENSTRNINFQYVVLRGTEKLTEGSVSVALGEKKEIELPHFSTSSERTSVVVQSEEKQKKVIYR